MNKTNKDHVNKHNNIKALELIIEVRSVIFIIA